MLCEIVRRRDSADGIVALSPSRWHALLISFEADGVQHWFEYFALHLIISALVAQGLDKRDMVSLS